MSPRLGNLLEYFLDIRLSVVCLPARHICYLPVRNTLFDECINAFELCIPSRLALLKHVLVKVPELGVTLRMVSRLRQFRIFFPLQKRGDESIRSQYRVPHLSRELVGQ